MAKSKDVFLSFFIVITVHLTIAVQFKPSYDGLKKQYKRNDIERPNSPVSKLPAAILDFNEAFRLEVKKCANLTKMFDLDEKITPSEFYAGAMYLSIAETADQGSKYSSDYAIIATRNIPSNCKKLGDDLMIAVYSDSMAKILYKQKILNRKNARNLAKSYSEQMKRVYRKVANEAYPRSKVAALPIAVTEFVSSQFNLDETIKRTIINIYGEEWRFQAEIGNIPDADKKIPPIKNPDENPLVQPDPAACPVSKAVRQFNQFFQRAVKSSKTLTNLYRLPAPVMFSKGAYYTNLYQLQKYGVQDGAILADFMSKYVDDEMARKPNVFVSVMGKFLGKYLESDIILNCRNAESLASRFAKILEDNAKFIAREKNPRSKIVSMASATYQFLRELRAFDSSRAKKLAFFFGNEWKCQESKN